MSTLLTSFLDLLFPPRPTELLVRSCTSQNIQPHVKPINFGLLQYQDPLVQALITEAKFYNNQSAHRVLGEVLHTALTSRTRPYILIPVPLSYKRQRERGYNQVSAVLKTQPILWQATKTDVVIRERHTVAQTTLDRKARLMNVEHAFSAHAKAILRIPKECEIIIIDDVTTTGATLQAVAEALQIHTAQPITRLALAH